MQSISTGLLDRKHWPTTWSPDMEFKRNSSFHSLLRTPPKTASPVSAPKLGAILRSSPRKRLLLGEVERIPLTPEKIDFSDISTPEKFKITSPMKSTPPMKKSRLEKLTKFSGPIDAALKGLSRTQLISVIKNITYTHPEIEEETQRDADARLSPARGEIELFEVEYLQESADITIDFNNRLACLLPRCDTFGCIQKVCRGTREGFGGISALGVCYSLFFSRMDLSLKKGDLSQDFLIDVQDKLQDMVTDSDDIQTCLKHIQGQLQE
ncbi:unnamed protein product [Diatraea saccharalis]|uniref:Uncharacterized protein n=1 Tax=Diatraea saccharalis TaxID=40085 RepID=A0A9N9R1P2_9NEOP|nr:unnamed protein product [Diatraea saccharalis]